MSSYPPGCSSVPADREPDWVEEAYKLLKLGGSKTQQEQYTHDLVHGLLGYLEEDGKLPSPVRGLRPVKVRPLFTGPWPHGCEGRFHCWMQDSIEGNDGGFGLFPAAIVELNSGQILLIPADRIQFLDREEEPDAADL